MNQALTDSTDVLCGLPESASKRARRLVVVSGLYQIEEQLPGGSWAKLPLDDAHLALVHRCVQLMEALAACNAKNCELLGESVRPHRLCRGYLKHIRKVAF
ncbi:MAG: hypothetical protein KIT11_05665 [Fimbriimonadaceae bacterium]|nr:hypothetical protein [Fimbriimonadaceae bacterium]QYK56619.1 MAG: hypothetical protein KF733_03850 [Fimbriimonadaceae bacterium]